MVPDNLPKPASNTGKRRERPANGKKRLRKRIMHIQGTACEGPPAYYSRYYYVCRQALLSPRRCMLARCEAARRPALHTVRYSVICTYLAVCERGAEFAVLCLDALERSETRGLQVLAASAGLGLLRPSCNTFGVLRFEEWAGTLPYMVGKRHEHERCFFWHFDLAQDGL